MTGDLKINTTILSRRSFVAGAIGAMTIPAAISASARAIEVPATDEDERFMHLAIEEATKGDYPFGTVITREGRVLIRGHNLSKQEQDPTAHGEMIAIRRLPRGLRT
jgi:tRNA(adenine34) deaminase